MKGPHRVALFASLLAIVAVFATTVADEGADSGVIRLGAPAPSDNPGDDDDLAKPSVEARRGFDYRIFGERLENYWFQRKLHLREGRDDDAVRQAQNIAAFVKEEGVRRLEAPAGALLAEASRHAGEGHYARARHALTLADTLDPERPQTHFLRAQVAWESGGGVPAAATDLLAGVKASLLQIVSQPDATQTLALKLFLALMGLSIVFPLLMVLRYQAPMRHEVEEWLTHRGREPLAAAGGWAVLLAPLVLWVGVGWTAVWWTVITFRFMRVAERTMAVGLLVATAFAVPGYRMAVGLYGLATDPKVRTTVAAAAGAYEPDRIVKLQELVEAYPDDPTYRFLLAGLYKNGRFLEEAFDEYGHVLRVAPDTWQARVNIGNIYYQTGQYSEAIAQYGQAIAMRPRDVLAYCNMHMAQTESFRLNEAKATFDKARAIDAKAVADVFASSPGRGNRASVVDASIDLRAIWRAALEGRKSQNWLAGGTGSARGWGAVTRGLLNPLSAIALLSVVACGALVLLTRSRPPAGRCSRCGRAYCAYCRSSRDDHDYCSQCMHLFVLQDGLAPETKTRKLYEVEAHRRRLRVVRRISSVLVPGSGLVLTGRTAWGAVVVLGWLVALFVCVPAAATPVERLLGFDLRLDLLRAGAVPGMYDLNPAILLAVPLAAVTWIAGNVALRRTREA